jgi:hypothetical protein
MVDLLLEIKKKKMEIKKTNYSFYFFLTLLMISSGYLVILVDDLVPTPYMVSLLN